MRKLFSIIYRTFQFVSKTVWTRIATVVISISVCTVHLSPVQHTKLQTAVCLCFTYWWYCRAAPYAAHCALTVRPHPPVFCHVEKTVRVSAGENTQGKKSIVFTTKQHKI